MNTPLLLAYTSELFFNLK